MPRILSRSDFSRSSSFSMRHSSSPDISSLQSAHREKERSFSVFKKRNNMLKCPSVNCIGGANKPIKFPGNLIQNNRRSTSISTADSTPTHSPIESSEEFTSASKTLNENSPPFTHSRKSSKGLNSKERGMPLKHSNRYHTSRKSFLPLDRIEKPDEWGQFVDVSELDHHQIYGRFVVSPHNPRHLRVRSRKLIR